MQNSIPHQVQLQSYTGLCFTLKTSPTHSKTFWIWSNQNHDFRFKNKATKPLKREKGKNHKLPSFRCSLKIQRYLLLWNFHTKIPPLFSQFSIFDKNVNLSKANPEAENFFLVFPSLKYLDFTTYPKIASTSTPFEGPDSKSHPPKFQSLTF
jgi:hypothetical protein